ncbi:Pfs NACHT and ankyrin domain protein [Penicillium argentinense]|uniref:Pfs NACHT and ankyrin domain protein n=1 Tax=Penicillium argentinense TaxID=1131581 RepID=A0A9W9EJE9_9EURO|nr:Pfs NACHT and ankyrin domain protein [Penicillium argentinense]KAJ5082839.1 Pfs NACHT and ankyrin domain protein [Penicillium argentinense]
MAAARAMLDDIHQPLPTHADDANTYVLGSIKQQRVVIACLPAEKYGTNSAATVITNMKRSFPAIRASLMVGIGGGVPSKSDIHLGDVVVGIRVMQYDLGKIVGDGKFQRTAIPRAPDMLLGTAVSALRAKHELGPSRIPSILQHRLETNVVYGRPQAPDRLFLATYDHASRLSASCDECDHSKLVPRSERRPNDIVIHYGAIASGNQVMRHGVTRDNVARELDVICFEMETAGLMDILPCLPIRGICDYSDSHRNKEWQRYAAATAAAYARELIEEIPITETHVKVNYIRETYESLSSERRQCLLKSLGFEQIDSRKLTIKAAHAKTCRWLLSHPSYEEWLNPAKLIQHHGFLWISGKPGAGKSTIMKFAYLNLKRKPHYTNAVTASFFFNARGESLEKTISGMYRSLLLQLLEGYPDLQTVLDDSEIVSQTQRGCPPLNVLKELFYNAVSALGNRLFTCFVDALDECDEQQVVDMVQCFEDLAEQSTAKGVAFRVCFSSRHYPYIVIQRGIRLTLEDQPGHTEDLSAYVASRLIVTDVALKEELRSKLIKKAAGVFMWVVLVVDMLNKEHRRGGWSLRRRLAELPSDLSELFKNILNRDKENTEALKLCVVWVLYAERPLQPDEFYHALWSGLSLKGLVDNQIPDVAAPDPSECQDKFKRYIISSSKGLAETTKAKQPTVQFIHESVRDFLVKEKGLQEMWPEIGYDSASPSHETLKQCCSVYLNHSLVRQSVNRLPSKPSSSIQSDISQRYPFLQYATQHILHHANAAAKVCPQDKFLSAFTVADWIVVNNLFEKFKIRRYTANASCFYIFAEKGLSELIRTMAQEDPQVYMPWEKYKYPLFAALASGSRDTVAAVLDLPSTIRNGVNIIEGIESKKDFKGYESRTPLSWAAENGYTEIVKLLQTDQTINQMDRLGHTPLHWASIKGKEAVARLLIDKGADIDASDKNGCTSLHLASINGNEAIARLLIERGADIHAGDKNGYTSLRWAFRNDHEGVARLLIERGADVNTSDKYGETLLHWAFRNDHEGVARLLIERGADVNTSDKYGETLLHWAFRNDHEGVARLLIERGADVNTSDKYGETSLHWASRNGKEAIARLLIESGADIHASDKDGGTSLHWASRNGHEAIARLLIESGAGIHAGDKDGETSLHWACRNGREAIARLLIESGADIHAGDKDGVTSLHWAYRNGREAIARLLIESGADIHAGDKDGRQGRRDIASLGACRNSHAGLAGLLIKKGEVHASDKNGWISLHWASINGHEVTVRLLLESEPEINTSDINGCTPLQKVSMNGNQIIVRLLIEKGADINSGVTGLTSLYWASMKGHKEVVNLLLDSGAMVDTGVDAWTTLQQAVLNDQKAVTRLLIEKEQKSTLVTEMDGDPFIGPQ